MKKIVLFISICFLSSGIAAQNPIDSLKNVLAAAPEDTNRVNALLELSWQLLIRGEYEESISEAELAGKLAKRIHFPKGIAASSFAMASGYLYLGKHEVALEHYFKSLKISEELKDESIIAKHYGNIGNVYYSLRDYSNALEYYQKAFDKATEQGDKERAPAFFVNIGNVYKEQENYDKALELYIQAIDLYDKAEKKTNGKAILLGNIGNLYCLKGEYEKSLDYFFRALKLREELDDKRGIETNLGNIGGVYIYMSRFEEAEEYLNKAIAIAREIGDLEGVMYLTDSMSELFAKKKEWSRALFYYKRFTEIKDSLFNETKSQQIAEMQTQFEVEKKEKELALFRQDQKLTKYKAYFLAAVLFLVSLLAAVLINRQRIKIKKQKEAHDLEQQLAQAQIERARLEKQNLEANLTLNQEKLNHITDLFKEKSKLMDKMQEQLDKTAAENAQEGEVKNLLNNILESIDPNEYWEEFITSFNLVNKNFFEQIQKKFPDLTRNELRLCALIKCNLGNKEIANVLNITPDSVKKSRNRLRKRLQLEADDSLTKYIQFLN
jgi:tetratricopeptide (TPR) repeat protein